MDLVLADLPAASLPFSQAFSAGWRNSSAASSAPLPLSGNPGYLPGRPLLVSGLAAWAQRRFQCCNAASSCLLHAQQAARGHSKQAAAHTH